MEWVNIHTTTARQPQYLSASNLERATWFSLLSYCAAMENGGVIRGAASWPDTVWMMSAGVKSKDVQACRTLVRVEGDDVAVLFYPTEQQDSMRKKRDWSKAANEARWKKKQDSTQESVTHPTKDSDTDSDRDSVMKGNVREGKEKESPPNPQGGLSEGGSEATPESEAEQLPALRKFLPLVEVLAESPQGITVSATSISVLWRNVIEGKAVGLAPDDRGFLEHLTATLETHVGRIGALPAWLAARATEFQGQKKQAARAVTHMGPGA